MPRRQFIASPPEGGLPPQPSAPPALGGGTTTVTAVQQPSIVAAPMAGRVVAAPRRTDMTDAGFQLGGLAVRPAQFEAAPTPAAAAQMAPPPPPVFQPREYVPGLYMPQDRGGYSEAQGAAFADQARQGSWHESQRQMEAARAANDRQRSYDMQASTPRMADMVQARRQALQAFQRNSPPNVGSQSEMARPQPTMTSAGPQRSSLFGNGSGKAAQVPTAGDKQRKIKSLGGAVSAFGGK